MATVGNLMVNIGVNATGIATGLARAEASLERFGSRMFFMGGRMTAGVTVPLALLSGAILKLGTDFDDAMTESLAIMDNKGRAMRQSFEKQAIELSKISTFSATEIAKGYYSLASAGLTGEQSLASMTKVAKFAQAGLMSVEQAAKFLSGSVKALGVDMVGATDEVSAMAKVADTLTKANNLALGTVTTFSQALTNKAAMAGQIYKISLEELTAVLMAYHQQNIEGRVAGQQTWMTLRDLQRATLKNADAWKKFGVSVFDSAGQLRPVADIMRGMAMRFEGYTAAQVRAWLAGEKIGKAAGKAMTAMERTAIMAQLGFQDRSRASTQAIMFMSEAMRRYMGELENSAGETERVAAMQMESMKKQLTMMWRELQAELLTMFESMRPMFDSALKPALRSILDFTKKMVKAFSELSPDTQQWIIKFTMAAMAMGPVISMLGSWTLFVTGLIGSLQAAFSLIGRIGLRLGAKLGGAATGTAAALQMPAWMTSTTTAGFTGTAAAGAMASQTGMLAKATQGLSYSVAILEANWAKMVKGWTLWTLVWPIVRGAFQWLTDNLSRLPAVLNGLTLGLAGLVFKLLDVAQVINGLRYGGFKAEQYLGVAKLLPQFLDDFGTMLSKWTYLTLDWVANIAVQIPKGFANIWAQIARDFGFNLDGMRKTAATSPFMIPVRFAFSLASMLGGGQGGGPSLQGLRDMKARTEDKFAEWVGQSVPWLGMAIGGGNMWGRGEVSGADIFKGSAWWFEQQAALWEGSRKKPIGTRPLPGGGFVGTPEMPLTMGPDLSRALRADPGSFPDGQPNAAALRKAERDKQILDEILGEGSKRWQDYYRVFEKNQILIKNDSDAMARMLNIYKQFRSELSDLPPVFEQMYQAENAWIALMRDDPVQGMIAEMVNFVPAMNDIEKAAQQLEWAFEDMGGTPLINPEYFAKHRAELDQLAMRYTHMGPNVQKLIDQYWKWAEAQKRVEDHTKHLEFQDRALEGLAATQAKIADKERELEAFRWDESDRTFKNMRRGWAALEDETSKQFAREATAFSKLKGSQVAEAAATLVEIARANQRYIEITKRLDREREASAAGVNQLIVRSFQRMSDKALDALIRLKKNAKNIWFDILNEMSGAFATLGKVFEKDGEGWLTWLGKVAGLTANARDVGADMKIAFENVRDAFNTKDWSRFGTAIVTAFSAVAKGIDLMDQATNSASKLKNVIGGASVGAEMGNQIVPGGWGALGGAILGALVGAFRTPQWVKVMKDVGKDWGVTIGEELAKTIAETSKKKFGGDRSAAELWHFSDILAAAGGLNEGNIEDFYNKFTDVVAYMNMGYLTAADGMKVLTDNFDSMAGYFIDRGLDVATAFEQHMDMLMDLVQVGVVSTMQFQKFLDANFKYFVQSFEESGRVASAAFVDLIEKYKELGLVSKEVSKFIIAQGAKAATGWAAVLESIMSGGVSEYASKLQGINDQIEETEKKIMDGEGDVAKLEEKLNELLEYRGQLMAEQSDLVNKYSADVKRMGSIILATFNQMIDAGVPWMTALDTVGSSLDKLIEAYRILGVTSDNAAVNELTWWRDIMTQNKELFAGLDGLTQGTIALSSMGKISQGVFDDLMAQGVSMFGFMKDAVAKFGGNSTDALRAMVPWLAVVRDMAKEYGLILDDDTQAMIDLAIEMGLMSATSQTAASIMKDGFKDVVTGLKDVVAWLESIGKKLGAIPPKTTITIDTKITGPGIPDVPGDPDDKGGQDEDGVPRFAKGVYATKPRLGWFGEGGEPELGGPVDFMSKALAGAMAQTGGTGQDIHVTLVMPDGDVLLKQVVRAGKKRGVL